MKNLSTKLILVLICCFCAALFLGGDNTFAAEKVWTGASGIDDNFSTPTNWSDHIAPGNGDDLVFPAPSAYSTANADMDPYWFGSVEIHCDSYDYTHITGDIMIANLLTGQGCEDFSPSFEANIILTGDLTVTDIHLDYGGTIDVGPYTLNLDITNSQFLAFARTYTGSGVINFNGNDPASGNPLLDLLLGTPTSAWMAEDVYAMDFTGVININTSVIFKGRPYNSALFNINPAGAMTIFGKFDFEEDTNIPNSINIYRSGYSIGIFCSSYDELCLFNLPNITLYSDSVLFASSDEHSGQITVDLTGITANGHCLTYETINLESLEIVDGSALFIGGPTICDGDTDNMDGGDGNTGATDSEENGDEDEPEAPKASFFSRLSGRVAGSAIFSAAAGSGIALALYIRRKAKIAT